MEYTIPRRTQEMLLSDHPEGTRHHAKIKIALPLLGEGLPYEAVVATLKEKFPQATDREVRHVVDWCSEKNPTPSVRNGAAPKKYQPTPVKISPKQSASVFASGAGRPVSPIKIPSDGQTALLFKTLYDESESLNIVCKFTTAITKGRTKANPSGGGATKRRDEWIAYFNEKGAPSSDAGAWMRPNPVKEIGSGADGAITNSDVTDFRFLLLESDEISMDDQLAVYAKLKLPIAAILTSGGTSCHAWLRIDAKDSAEYSEKANRILSALLTFGFDQANKNPSRLSRLPGVERKIGAIGKQELLYLDNKAKGITLEEIDALEVRVQPQKFPPHSMKESAYAAIESYEDIFLNKNNRGLLTGFPIFDSITGGMKKGWLTIVAGETGAGKTSYVLNIAINALRNGKSVALFSFEMDQQEIMDIIFSREASINRNKFNNGYFSQGDFDNMAGKVGPISDYHLYTFDSPMMTIRDVFEAAERLAIEGPLDLVIIDYLQLANTEEFKDSREQQVASVSRTAKAMAKKLKVPVIGVSQLNEDGKVRESRAIAHDANCVIVVSEDDDDRIEAKVVKGRSIPRGTYYLKFQRELCSFIETGADPRLLALAPKEPR